MMFKNILQTKPQPLLLVSLNDANTFRERTAKLYIQKISILLLIRNVKCRIK
jgi:hypothetical protein